jgi:hypothetical protein
VFCRTEDQFVATCRNIDGLANVYASLHSRSAPIGNGSAVTEVKTFVIDIDPVRAVKASPASMAEMIEAEKVAASIKAWLAKEGISSIRAMTGNGVQVLIPHTTIKVDEELRLRFAAAGRFFRQFATDTAKIDNVADMARVLKVIGTLSIKGEERPGRPWREACWIDEPVRNESSQFIRWLSKMPLPKENETTMVVEPTAEASEWIAKLRAEDRMKIIWDKPKNEDRSKQDWIVTLWLIKNGASDGDIFNVLKTYPHGKYVRHARPEQYLAITVKNARRYISEKQ